MPSADDVIGWARKLDPYPYVFGAELTGSTPGPADCSELVEYACRNAGVPNVRDGSGNQFFWCYDAGLSISLDQAIGTKGALLFYSYRDDLVPPPNASRDYIYHVAFSLGNGRTFEARSESWGIGEMDTAGRDWYSLGGLIPGLDYGGGTPAPQPPPADQEWAGMRNLKEMDPRMKGSDVWSVQVLLLNRGYIVGGGADSVYGPATSGAVREFQADAHITVDGVVGPTTRTKLNGG